MRCILAIAIVCLLHLALADVQVTVTLPAALATITNRMWPTGLVNRPSLFGMPPFATKLQGIVVRSLGGKGQACDSIDKSRSIPSPWPMKGPGQYLFVMVDRGNCTFVQKTRMVEQAGGDAAIIVDNIAEAFLPYMADDNTRPIVNIPAVLITKQEGDLIKPYLVNYTVSMQLYWDVPRPDDRVEVDIWTSSFDPASITFKQNFEVVAKVFPPEDLEFQAHYVVLDGRYWGCTYSFLPCGTRCINGGRYCSVDPDGDPSKGVSGADIVIENLRQYCLWTYLNNTNQDLLWWRYVNLFQQNCADNVNYFNETCSRRQLRAIGVNPQIIDDMITASGGIGRGAQGGVNRLLQKQIDDENQMGVFIIPTLYVNQRPYRGYIDCPTNPLQVATCGVLKQVCLGYLEGTLPWPCEPSNGCALGTFRDGCGVCNPYGSPLVNSSCSCPQYGPMFAKDKSGTCCLKTSIDPCTSLCSDVWVPVVCGECNGEYLKDCNGTCRGKAKLDCAGVCMGTKGLDACGRCYARNDPNYNKTCMDCMGVPNGKAERDCKGICGGNSDCMPVPVYAIILIVLGGIGVGGLGVWLYVRKQQVQMKSDIDSLLKQYLPLEAANSLAHPKAGRSQPLVPSASEDSETAEPEHQI